MRSTGSQSTSEAELIRRCQAGDTASFDVLVRQHYQLAYNIAYRMLGDADSAADATQAAFVRAFRALDNFRAQASFSTWLHRLAVNVVLMKLPFSRCHPSIRR